MPDDSSSSARRSEDSDGGGRLWQGLKTLLGVRPAPTAREQLEDFLDGDGDLPGTGGGETSADDLSATEREMLKNLLHFGELTADDAAVPRSDIIAIAETASFDDLVAAFVEAGHSRLPVYRETLDDIIGMIHVKDVFAILAGAAERPTEIAALMRQPRYVPQSMRALELLADMRASRTHLAIVLDEYSGTDGLVTIEDLMEEIVGDIEDEHDDEPEELVIASGDGTWDVDARVELEDLADQLDARLEDVDEDVDTIGGLAVVLAGQVPAVGDILTHSSGWRIEVVEADERRVAKVRLHRPVEAAIGDGK
jgi:CBS domain containing-hemolysin-like protein